MSSMLKIAGLNILFGCLIPVVCMAAPPTGSSNFKQEPQFGTQVVKEVAVRVLDENEQAVVGAIVKPWALRSSQGHGWWVADDQAQMGPQEIVSDSHGMAIVKYPYFRSVEEGTRTIGVSIFVDHPEFAYPEAIHIDVPLEDQSAHEVKLEKGFAVVLIPKLDGETTDTNNLYALWSDGRSGLKQDCLERRADGTLRLPPLKSGRHSVLLARIDGDRVTHQSSIIEFDVTENAEQQVEFALRPTQAYEGKLSDAVPRPIRNGRVKVMTLNPSAQDFNRVNWHSWARVREDGTFTIDAWPPGEAMQLIALCDGFSAKNGLAPSVVEKPVDPKKDPFGRPQVFQPSGGDSLVVEMEPLIECKVSVVDNENQPLAGIDVSSYPNVGWWNWGSQVYCSYLYRSESWLLNRELPTESDEFPELFQAKSDQNGMAVLNLPKGRERLYVASKTHELPVFLGSRDVRIELIPGEFSQVTLQLQGKGTDRLGEWDKLAGVVFGCSTREGRRICALPDVREKMEQFQKQFREAKNQRDPKLLSEAYATVAKAFHNVKDYEEAAKWQKKADQQFALIEAAAGEDDKN